MKTLAIIFAFILLLGIGFVWLQLRGWNDKMNAICADEHRLLMEMRDKVYAGYWDWSDANVELQWKWIFEDEHRLIALLKNKPLQIPLTASEQEQLDKLQKRVSQWDSGWRPGDPERDSPEDIAARFDALKPEESPRVAATPRKTTPPPISSAQQQAIVRQGEALEIARKYAAPK